MWNQEVHHRIHKIPQSASILSQIDPVYVPIQHLEDKFQYYPPIYAWVFHVTSQPKMTHCEMFTLFGLLKGLSCCRYFVEY